MLDGLLHYKTRASLQLDGVTYTAGDFRISIIRAVQRPNNRFLGIVVDVEVVAVESPSAGAGALDEIHQMLKESADAVVAGGTGARITMQCIEEDTTTPYGLSTEVYSEHHRAVEFVQVMKHLMGM